MNLKFLCSALLLLLAFAGGAGAETLTFKLRGSPLKTLSVEEMSRLVAPVEVSVFEPHEGRIRRYKGFPFSALLNAVYPDGVSGVDEVLFACRDGYQPSIPIDTFGRYQSYLIYAGSDGEPFTLRNKLQGGERVDLGPFYLVWDNLSNEELRKEGAAGWPYQVVAVDLINFRDRFPKMAPPDSATPTEVRGFLAFRQHCMSCHTINGEGGGKAPELNYPVSVTEYMGDEWLYRWISSPESIRYKTTMPALPPDVPGRDGMIRDIVSYLRIMRDNKRPPAEAGAD
ncbi:MAG: c-type cytochrome [Candidatus Methanosuratincola sp.]